MGKLDGVTHLEGCCLQRENIIVQFSPIKTPQTNLAFFLSFCSIKRNTKKSQETRKISKEIVRSSEK